jgi:hypothetical protein
VCGVKRQICGFLQSKPKFALKSDSAATKILQNMFFLCALVAECGKAIIFSLSNLESHGLLSKVAFLWPTFCIPSCLSYFPFKNGYFLATILLRALKQKHKHVSHFFFRAQREKKHFSLCCEIFPASRNFDLGGPTQKSPEPHQSSFSDVVLH